MFTTGSGTRTEHGDKHEDPGSTGFTGSSNLSYDVCTWLCQQGLLLCLPFPA